MVSVVCLVSMIVRVIVVFRKKRIMYQLKVDVDKLNAVKVVSSQPLSRR